MTAIKFNPRLKLAPIIWLDQPNGTPLLIPGLLPVLTTQNPVFLLCRISFFLLLKRERSGGWWLLFGSNNQDVYILLGSSFFHWWSLESQKVCMDICWSKTWFQTLVPCKVLCSLFMVYVRIAIVLDNIYVPVPPTNMSNIIIYNNLLNLTVFHSPVRTVISAHATNRKFPAASNFLLFSWHSKRGERVERQVCSVEWLYCQLETRIQQIYKDTVYVRHWLSKSEG